MNNRPAVTLLYHSPISLIARGARTCTDSLHLLESDDDLLAKKDKDIIRSKILSLFSDSMNPPHESVLEHLVYTFDIDGISRAVLQELARHRIGIALSVQSTRYALKKLFRKALDDHNISDESLDDMLILTGDEDIDNVSRKNLYNIIDLYILNKAQGIKTRNDTLKFPLPEAFALKLQYTINARALRNFLVLRTARGAMWEIRRLAYTMYEMVPDHHKFLFADRLHPSIDAIRCPR